MEPCGPPYLTTKNSCGPVSKLIANLTGRERQEAACRSSLAVDECKWNVQIKDYFWLTLCSSGYKSDGSPVSRKEIVSYMPK